MRVFVGVAAALQPLIITKRAGPRGYESVEGIIPGSTLAGALSSALQQTLNMSVSDAYPVVCKDKGTCIPSMPTPPTAFKIKLIFRAKHKGVIGKITEPSTETIKGPGGAPTKILFPPAMKPSDARQYAIEYWHGEVGAIPWGLVKSIKTPTIIPIREYKAAGSNKYWFYEIDTIDVRADQVHDSVSINPSRGSGEREILYTYHALPAGSIYWFTIAIKTEKELDIEGEYMVSIGGAKRKGFGQAYVYIQEIEDPCSGLNSGDKYYVWSRLPTSPWLPGGKPIPGWSYRARGPKLSLPSLPPGTVLHKLPWSKSSHSCELRYLGLVPPMGQLEPIAKDQIIPVTYMKLKPLITEIARKTLKPLEYGGW